ncbi:ABC transporter ATP-binding protein [Campylobacter sp. RM9344]|uniref:ABC transporter ATP-binding protein n=1 Tax=Campylobacter californiensis TaxID=1032243 RepID=A0AAW3ZV84_9BACT|nr:MULTISPECIES: ABC transporter ATP-binding protein [unclassified Campylobacter]MBE2983898.1 ABC transporter ATP-binding protein [Campylobacter sp. RM6883]MBE2986060.1 ABC transporter ATP-binding protein [Campylobacter sp. RM12919]MBE2987473.1 ABC transporter ATP-binding protein [Campylobacter sp. RM12920]MBE2994436.1 ABC transporter ATP-binding protein [Campylobacter sp. RM6913]MBE3022583.1 ABC transporter ATP-binding protein [Campylobacter sp. 7477a]MBE3028744.1 ABC transporter ATP-binding
MIILKGITKTFSSQNILKNINLHIKKSQKVVIYGQNGAGKSSLMRIILGEFRPNNGEVKVCSADPFLSRKDALKNISFVPQTPPPLKFSLKELCEFVCKTSDVKFDRIKFFCDKLELDLNGNLNKPFYKLSGGMKQKMLVAIAFSKDSDVLIFDEPTANLDPKARGNFIGLLDEFAKSKTLVCISHRVDEVKQICDRYIEMDLGEIIKDETTGDHE